MKYFNFFYFIVSLAIGLLVVYSTAPPKNIIIVYPTPHNYNSYQYLDNANNCFVIKQTEIDCPKNKQDYISVPMQ